MEADPRLGQLIACLADRRADLRAAEAEVKRCEERLKEAKREFKEAVEGLGLKEARTSDWSASVVEKVVPQVTDWDKFYKFIHENNYYHLLQRRPSATGCEELFEAGTSIPGVEKFTKVDVSIRSVK